jgi:hypothetical protein
MLTSKSGTPVSGSFVLTAANGPVSNYTVRVAAMPGRVTIAPAGGSLLADGHVGVTVTVTSKAGLTTHIVLPGNLTVMVVTRSATARLRQKARNRSISARVVRWPLRCG